QDTGRPGGPDPRPTPCLPPRGHDAGPRAGAAGPGPTVDRRPGQNICWICFAIMMYTGMPIVTLYEKRRPSDAASGKGGVASGIASRWTAGTAMYDAAAQSTANRM